MPGLTAQKPTERFGNNVPGDLRSIKKLGLNAKLLFYAHKVRSEFDMFFYPISLKRAQPA